VSHLLLVYILVSVILAHAKLDQSFGKNLQWMYISIPLYLLVLTTVFICSSHLQTLTNSGIKILLQTTLVILGIAVILQIIVFSGYLDGIVTWAPLVLFIPAILGLVAISVIFVFILPGLMDPEIGIPLRVPLFVGLYIFSIGISGILTILSFGWEKIFWLFTPSLPVSIVTIVHFLTSICTSGKYKYREAYLVMCLAAAFSLVTLHLNESQITVVMLFVPLYMFVAGLYYNLLVSVAERRESSRQSSTPSSYTTRSDSR
jgi:hypothetical protein